MSDLEQDIERRIARDIAVWQRTVRGKGEPLVIDEGWLQTPAGLRMPFSVLKSAGVPPREIDLLQQRAHLREQLAGCGADPEREAERQRLQGRLSELEQHLALRLESLRRMGGE
ncbi:hypothetical protein N8H22_07590 [Stutzerimonas stutzeri]|jgi:hypothetical protein|uniref:hypothetical protein n=1 Tax=Stutzerimonas sp. S1 TaxID=3030652 RepID=UPI002224EE91|nr:hypothetical protein [Stutzerimonas sp. S1]MCW3148461.1 hypothetical protein [Stutzerimonas sp. S1]